MSARPVVPASIWPISIKAKFARPHRG